MSASTFLDDLLNKLIQSGGLPLPPRKALNFIGGTVTDNPTNDSTDVAAGGSWSTVLDVDFTAQPTQSLATNGSKAIAGLTWTRSNAAHDLVAMALTNGTGLVIQPAGSGYFDDPYSGVHRSAPLVFLPFTQIPGLAGMSWLSKFRLWVRSTVTGFQNTSQRDFAFLGIDSGSVGIQRVLSKGNNGYVYPGSGNANGVATGASYNAVAVGGWTGAQNMTLGAGNAVTMLELDAVDAGWLRGSFGAYAGAWPSYNAMTRASTNADGFVPSGGQIDMTTAPVDPRSMGIVLGAQADNPDAVIATIQRIRLDALL